MAADQQPTRLRLPWLSIRLAAFFTASRADRLFHAILGYLSTAIIGWAITAYACYWPMNRWLLPVERRSATDAIASIPAPELTGTGDGLKVTKGEDGLSLNVDVTNPGQKDATRQLVAQIKVVAVAHDEVLDKLTVTAVGAAGSDPKARMSEIVLFERAEEWPQAFFSTTHAVSLPASVHALQKSLTAFLTGLPESRAVKAAKPPLTLDPARLEEQAKALGEELKRFEGLGAEFNWNRRLNGKIQFLTVWAFWVAMIQMAARFWLHSVVERRIRKNVMLSQLWAVEWSALDDDALNKRSAICEFGRAELARRRLMGTHARSAYLDLYHAAIAAFKVEGDYKSVPAFVDGQSATIGDERSAGMGFIKYLIWSIPSLGFVGTVVGIGDALLETVNVDSLDVGQAAIAKSMVSSNIGVAFDTTLVALLLSLVSMLVYHLLIQFENLTIYRATSDTIRQFVRPGRAISENELAKLLMESIRKAAEAANRLHSVGARWAKIEESLEEAADLNREQAAVGRTQIVILVALVGLCGWLTWLTFRLR